MLHPSNELFQFAFFPNFEERIGYLAKITEPETWHTQATKNYFVLKHYLEYTYIKLRDEQRIVYTPDEQKACFNLGLATPSGQTIFALFEKNRVANGSPYFFKAFLREDDALMLTCFADHLPVQADYFTDPTALLFNPHLNVIPEIDHIVNSSKTRSLSDMRLMGEDYLRRELMRAISEAVKQAKRNYTTVVAQAFKGKIQLLLPLRLTPASRSADVALVMEKSDEANYRAYACLTLELAYMNARLIARPQSEWLKL